jgi:hypothetical protein
MMKLYFKFGVAAAILTILFVTYRWVTSFVVVKDKVIETYKLTIKADSINISALSQELVIKDDSISRKDTLIVLYGSQIGQLQQLAKDMKMMLSRAENDAKIANDAIGHYETNGLMRFFVEDKRLFKKDCYREVFEKPMNICK